MNKLVAQFYHIQNILIAPIMQSSMEPYRRYSIIELIDSLLEPSWIVTRYVQKIGEKVYIH